jgi:hypothetical protein
VNEPFRPESAEDFWASDEGDEIVSFVSKAKKKRLDSSHADLTRPISRTSPDMRNGREERRRNPDCTWQSVASSGKFLRDTYEQTHRYGDGLLVSPAKVVVVTRFNIPAEPVSCRGPEHEVRRDFCA